MNSSGKEEVPNKTMQGERYQHQRSPDNSSLKQASMSRNGGYAGTSDDTVQKMNDLTVTSHHPVTSNSVDNTVDNNCKSVCSNTPIFKHQQDILTVTQCKESLMVVFDLETTGYGDADVCQLSAVAEIGGSFQYFDQYIIPKKKIEPRATEVNGIEMIDGQMSYKGKPVLAKEVRCALLAFWNFLKEFHSPVILLAHNCFAFDAKILCRIIIECGLEANFCLIVQGIVDSLPIAKEMFPSRKQNTQESLVTDILQLGYEAHNSLEDSKMLHLLVNKLALTPDILSRHSRIFHKLISTRRNEMTSQKLKSVVSDLIFKKLCSSDLTLDKLKSVYLEGGSEAVGNLLSAKAENGKPRITKCRRIISDLCDFLEIEVSLKT